MSSRCLFCDIVAGRSGAGVILADDEFVAIHDKYPKAPVHALVIPRRHLVSLAEIGDLDAGYCQRMLEFVLATARELGVSDPGYRVITNVGRGGGQVIFHLHWHLLAGRSVGFDIEEEL